MLLMPEGHSSALGPPSGTVAVTWCLDTWNLLPEAHKGVDGGGSGDFLVLRCKSS